MHKILIVEDDADLALVLRKNLESYHFQVVVAYDAFQATRTAHTEKPNLIFLDLNLPAGGGISTLGNLKMSVNTTAIPVVVLTGTADEELIRRAQEKGVEAVMRKPYELKDLIAKVREILKIEAPEVPK